MGQVTRIGEVLDAVLTLVGDVATADPLGDGSKFQVLDGPKVGYVMENAICVGLTDGPERPGYAAAIEPAAGLGRTRTIERVTISCLLTMSTGDSDDGVLARLRTAATTVLAGIDDALRDQSVKRPIWSRAGLSGQHEWIPVLHQAGATVNVLFAVEATCLL
ncbi:hypothetical protein [Pseudactinotalea suaedae]|uniref:hypothetical protein n=1 Tax=Pseudactinotalea suaedae TaxID=1524924 RepID=UPI0012E1336F|nr:hypothetical protein [Pseudactinotalea suaedae]